jgi:hypothetical protein
MKKILLTILVFVVSLSLAGVAMATAPKPPASICLQASSSFYVFAVKPVGNLKMLDETEKFYSIRGAIIATPTLNMPLVGSGYVEGNVFHFTFNSTYNLSGTPYYVQAEGFWDVIAQTGTMYAYISLSGNWTWALSAVPCTGQVIVYSQELGAALSNEGSPFAPSK